MRQFYALMKPRVIQLIVFCALIGMVLAVPGLPTLDDVRLALVACAGIWLVAGAAAAFNCLVEKGIDAKMRRTAWRLRAGPLHAASRWIAALALWQFATGLSNVVLGWPMVAAVAHTGGAAALVIVLTWALCESRVAEARP